MDASGFTVIVLLGLVLLRGALLAVGAALILRPVTECPACFERHTFLLQRPWLRRLAPWLEWRFCPRCGWQGPSKKLEPVDGPQSARRPAAHSPHPFLDLGDGPDAPRY